METATQTKTLNYASVKNRISDWLFNYAHNANQKGYVIGVSGGIDSAVCSTLCALTGLPLIVVKMSIHQAVDQADRGDKHIEWLKANFKNVTSLNVDLTDTYDKTMETIGNANAFVGISDDNCFLACANTRARLRMTTLYAIAGAHKLLVCGTGNKVEDYGVGFFTKFGDGGIDLSPIGELLKSETYALGKELGIIPEILNARPSDGLWDDGRTDEDQLKATYNELEWAMNFCDKYSKNEIESMSFSETISSRQAEVITIYWKRHIENSHKMIMPPICNLSSLRE